MLVQKVYVVDDDVEMCAEIQQQLTAAGLASELFLSAEEFLAVYSSDMRGCIISDMKISHMNGLIFQSNLKILGCRLPR